MPLCSVYFLIYEEPLEPGNRVAVVQKCSADESAVAFADDKLLDPKSALLR